MTTDPLAESARRSRRVAVACWLLAVVLGAVVLWVEMR